MGILKNGPFGTTTGKIQNLVSYELKGKNVIRRIGITQKPASLKQLTVRQKMAVVIRFLKHSKAFIELGYKQQAIAEDKSAHNMATSYLTKNATMGDYPDIGMDYSKVMVAQGDLMQPVNPKVELLPGKLRFSWQNVPELQYLNKRDQVMMLAYFPETDATRLDIYGALRTAGEDFLEIDSKYQDARMEVYMAFISGDRETASDSIYLGRLND